MRSAWARSSTIGVGMSSRVTHLHGACRRRCTMPRTDRTRLGLRASCLRIRPTFPSAKCALSPMTLTMMAELPGLLSTLGQNSNRRGNRSFREWDSGNRTPTSMRPSDTGISTVPRRFLLREIRSRQGASRRSPCTTAVKFCAISKTGREASQHRPMPWPFVTVSCKPAVRRLWHARQTSC